MIMLAFKTRSEIRQFSDNLRKKQKTLALVPTMGALHKGHLALVRAAQEQADEVVVSIFVNPKQFAPHEDLATYPRTLDADLEALKEIGTSAVFIPDEAVIYPYPQAMATSVSVGGPSDGLESLFRPHFFQGVANVVLRLLLIVHADMAFFGEKDYQQLCVIKHMVGDLGLPVRIHGVPTQREPDGLALSSRNVYLSSEARKKAPALYQALIKTEDCLHAGGPVSQCLAAGQTRLEEEGFRVDYLSLCDSQTLAPLSDYDKGIEARLLAAAWLDGTRLIDNIAV
jgi:pantoate--beta-alanine ligase